MNETIPPVSGYPPQPKTSGLAIWSLVLGILSLVCFSIFSGIPGVICGHKALSKIKHSGGALSGQGLAIAGLVTGYLGILWAVIFIPMLLAIAIPNFVKARDTAMMNACLNNLRQIDAAKNQWALEKRGKTGDVPAAQDLKPYLKNGVFPTCPAGGTYTIGAVGNDPTCSIPEHTLSQPRMGDVGNGSTPKNDAIEVAATPQTMQAPNAVGVFIPAPYGTDMVHDPKRNILYISAGDEVLRYQMASNSFLPPLVLGGDLRGIDISPDNDLLAVADATDHNGSIGIHLVDLKTGTNTHVTFRAERMESGTYSVAFGADGAVWITSTIQGSGGLWPLRKYLPASKTTIAITTRVSQNTMLAASADREYIAYAEANSSAGDYGRFRCRATQLQPPLQANAFLYEIGISRDGTQLAVPNYAGVILSGSAAQKIDEKETIGAAYHPQRDFVFLARAGISTIAVYETATYTMVKELDFGDKFEWVGNHAFQRGRLRLSSDGKFVFCTVQGGIRCAETGL
jgi:hypothetical protein